MIFNNREEAGGLLVKKLQRIQGTKPLILAIPRGAVPMAKEIAEKLDGDLDIVLVHKIGAPDSPEYALGSVDENGQIYITPSTRTDPKMVEYVKDAGKSMARFLKRRRTTYVPLRSPYPIQDRIVVLVDDGIATGATLLAAIRSVRAQNPKEIIVASLLPRKTLSERIQLEVDEVVTLDIPKNFYSISQFYKEFPQVTDAEVIETLSRFVGRVA